MLKLNVLLLVLALSPRAFGAIPDEVNYEKFRDLYNAQKAVSDQARTHAENLKAAYNQKVSERQALESEKARLEGEIVRDQSAIQGHQNTIATLDSQIQSLQNSIQNNLNRIGTLQAESTQLESDAQGMTGQIQSQTVTVGQYEQARTQAANALLAAEQQHADATAKVQGAQQEAQQAQARIGMLRARIDRIQEETQELSQELNALDGESKSLANEITTLQQQRNQLAQTLADTEAQRAELEAKADKTPEEQQELQKLTQQVANQTNRLQALVQNLEHKIRRKNHVGRLLEVGRDQVQTARMRAIPELRQDISQAQSEVQIAQSKAVQLQEVANEWLKLVTTRKIRFEEADREYQGQVSILTQYQSELQAMRDRQAAIATEVQNLTAQNQNFSGQEQAKESQKTNLNQTIALLNTAISRRQARISVLEVDIGIAQSNESKANQAYQVAETKAQTEEGKTSAANSLYQKVLAEYNRQKEAARRTGVADGSKAGNQEGVERGAADGSRIGDIDGNGDGLAKGERDGRSRDYNAGYATGRNRGITEAKAKGDADGNATGNQDGTKKGYNDGVAQGYAKGKKDGHGVGYKEAFDLENNAENTQKGYDAGYAKGLQKAVDQAKREDYPQGRKDKENEILSTPIAPENIIELDLSAALQQSWMGRLASRLITAAWAEDKPVPATIPAIAWTYKQYLQSYLHPDFDTSYQGAYNTSYRTSYESGYRGQYQVSYRKAYDSRYKSSYDSAYATNYPDETQRGDTNGYQAGYKAAYQPAYNAAYKSAYDTAYAAANANGQPVKYQQGFDEGKVVGLDEGAKAGAATAFAAGQAKGEPDGYQQNLAAQKQLAYDLGKSDLQAEYDSNYKVKLVSAKIIDKSGDGKVDVDEELTLEVVVRNFGGRTLPGANAAVTVKDVGGSLVAEKAQAALKDIPAGKQATLKRALKLSAINGAPLNFKAGLKVDGKDAGDATVESEVVQALQVTLTNSQGKHPMLIGGLGQWYGNRVWLKNLSSRPMASGYKVRIEALNSNLKVSQSDWSQAVAFGSLSPNVWNQNSLWISARQFGKFDSAMFLVEVKNEKGRLIYYRQLTIPVHVN